ncbi:MAG: hypothetical protein CMP36_03365 [Rickettsiales bacterium]|nr:hypothetical protein [Rickettsiales bacterium]OUV79038.1 MAG: hypothetical protein CBC91_04120 [Rickettsiales bacterium TMED131]
MHFKKVTVFFSFFFFFSNFSLLAEDYGVKKLGKYGNWSVYSKTKNLCYMIAEPEKSEGKYKMRGRVRIVVYRNSEKIKNSNVVGFDFGYSFPQNAKATIEIDTKKAFQLSTFGQTAWTGIKSKTDKQIIIEMEKGNKLVALGKSKRGTDTKDTYSLSGFSKAFEKISKYCG